MKMRMDIPTDSFEVAVSSRWGTHKWIVQANDLPQALDRAKSIPTIEWLVAAYVQPCTDHGRTHHWSCTECRRLVEAGIDRTKTDPWGQDA